MDRKFELVNRSAIRLDEKSGLYKVEAIRCGKWDYPEPGGDSGFEITPAVIKELHENFESKIMGEEVALNVGHDEGTDCGWVKGTEIAPDGKSLYALVEITEPDIKTKVDNGTLKYSSSELDFERICPELSAGGDSAPRIVLEGLALTNHPYVKNMDPIRPVMLTETAVALAGRAFLLTDTAALDAGGVHFPSESEAPLLSEDDDSPARPEEKPKGGTMPVITLEESQAEVTRLQALLAEKDGGESTAKAALAETRSLRIQLAERDANDKIRALIRRGKVTPAVGNRALRLCEMLIRSDNAQIKLAEPVKVRKVALAESGDDSVDKLDMIGEVVDMLSQLPDTIATPAANLAEEDDPTDDKKGTDEEELTKLADEEQEKAGMDGAGNPKCSRRDALKRARKRLAEKRGAR